MWYTDDQLSAIPALADANPDEVSVIVDAAGQIYGYVQANGGVSDGDLRAWAEQAGIGPECFNGATAFLRQAGKAVQLSGSLGPGRDLGGAASDTASAVLTAAFTAKDLQGAAKRVGAEIASSATKEEHADAIVQAVLTA